MKIYDDLTKAKPPLKKTATMDSLWRFLTISELNAIKYCLIKTKAYKGEKTTLKDIAKIPASELLVVKGLMPDSVIRINAVLKSVRMELPGIHEAFNKPKLDKTMSYKPVWLVANAKGKEVYGVFRNDKEVYMYTNGNPDLHAIELDKKILKEIVKIQREKPKEDGK